MSIKIRTKGFFETKAHRVISHEIGKVIVMPEEDYEEVKDLCEVIELPPEKKKVTKPTKKKEYKYGTGKSKVSRNN